MGKLRREDIRQVLARNVSIQREKRGWTHEQLADAASLSFRHISIIESGKSACYLDTLSKLSMAFKLEEAELLDRSTTFSESSRPKVGRPRKAA